MNTFLQRHWAQAAATSSHPHLNKRKKMVSIRTALKLCNFAMSSSKCEPFVPRLNALILAKKPFSSHIQIFPTLEKIKEKNIFYSCTYFPYLSLKDPSRFSWYALFILWVSMCPRDEMGKLSDDVAAWMARLDKIYWSLMLSHSERNFKWMQDIEPYIILVCIVCPMVRCLHIKDNLRVDVFIRYFYPLSIYIFIYIPERCCPTLHSSHASSFINPIEWERMKRKSIEWHRSSQPKANKGRKTWVTYTPHKLACACI